MTEFIQQSANALALGGTYALLALGLALVFSILGFINFAHGEIMTITGYSIFFALSRGIPFGPAVVLAVIVATIAAVLMERVAFRPVRGSSPTTLLITSFALTLILQALYQTLISPLPKGIAIPALLDGTVDVFGLTLGRVQLLSIVLAAAACLGLSLFLRKTLMGVAIRAAADDFVTTRLMGVRANAVIVLTFAISGLLAGLAGVLLVAQRGSVDPTMGFLPVLKAFIAVVIGGLGSLPGAVVGGLLLGALEVMLQAYLPASLLPFRDAFVLSILIGVLAIRPDGLFGTVEGQKA